MADPWTPLREELDRWRSRSAPATVWWRDDDAAQPGEALDRLLALAGRRAAPLWLAVIPARAGPALARRLAGVGGAEVSVVQHGWAHENHAREGKRHEIGEGRPRCAAMADLARGRDRLDALFPGAWTPVLVPPWNRIAAGLLPGLPDLGLAGLSRFGPRRARRPAPGLVECNAHVDLVDWRARRGRAPAAVAGDLSRHLAARRAGEADPAEPSGVLSHHLAHDDTAWRVLEDLVGVLAAHPAARWMGAGSGGFAP